MTLQEIYLKYKRGDWPDKGSVHSYIDIYDQLLAPYRETAKSILEIGLMSGESLRMWADYFPGNVYGIDCDLKPHGGLADLTQAIADGMNIVIGDATNEADIRRFFAGMKFDVIIEDAGHSFDQQKEIYKVLKPYISKGGIYIIEDVQDIDTTKDYFQTIGEVIDLRNKKGRYDDVLIIIR